MIPRISIVVPVHNAAPYLAQSLPPLVAAANRLAGELLVVDDASSDGSGALARQLGAEVHGVSTRSGAARARNLGAERARGDILVFVDADTVAGEEALVTLLHDLDDPDLAAGFGGYDDSPPAAGFMSRYMNLRHHHYHARGKSEAETFWTGCGAMRTEIFRSTGGFDPDYEGIEDVELGIRLRAAGHRIRLNHRCRVTHLKRWTLGNALSTDIMKRALLWSRLLVRRPGLGKTLNAGRSEQGRALVALGLLVGIILASAGVVSWSAPVLLLILAGLVNGPLWTLFRRRAGILFASAAFVYHQAYYLYSMAVFVYCWIEGRFQGMANTGQVKPRSARDEAEDA